MIEYTIPGVIHKVRVGQDSGSHRIEILLRGSVVASVNLTSHTEAGVKKALKEAISESGVGHQIPDSVIDNLAGKLTEAGGYLGALISEEAATEDKLDTILKKLETIELRLEVIEKRLK
ncbi:MAG: hypothetical protein ACTSP4_09660 [Candidatus Hodarchaeales archaeon]